MIPIPFEDFAADALLEQRGAVAAGWVRTTSVSRAHGNSESLRRLTLPVAGLLTHVAGFVQSGEEEALTASAPVFEGLTELRRLWGEHGVGPVALVRDLGELAPHLDQACLRWVEAYPGTTSALAVARVAGRMNRAPYILCGLALASHRQEDQRRRQGVAQQMRVFTDTLAHELRTPLNAAQAAAAMLDSSTFTLTREQQRRLLALVRRGLGRAARVIQDASAFALVAASPDGRGRRLPLRVLVADVVACMRDEADAAGVQVELVEPVPDLQVDATYFELVLRNLVGNAIKYSDPVRESRWVRIGFECQRGLWWARVSDNGLGIPHGSREKVFHRFYRAHPEHADGTGLGLTLVRETLERVGGRIELASEPGAGTTIAFSLPGSAESALEPPVAS